MLGCANEKKEDVEDKTSATQIRDDDTTGGQCDTGDDRADEDAESDPLESKTEGPED
nr:hypothetical protein [candidate division Zixibacteria bacterium]